MGPRRGRGLEGSGAGPAGGEGLPEESGPAVDFASGGLDTGGSAALVSAGCQAQQLAVNLEPQGLLYAKLTLSEQREAPGTAEPRVFGLPLPLLVEREQPPGQVPLIIQKCVAQIERRGLRVSASPRPHMAAQLLSPGNSERAMFRIPVSQGAFSRHPTTHPCCRAGSVQLSGLSEQARESLAPRTHNPTLRPVLQVRI